MENTICLAAEVNGKILHLKVTNLDAFFHASESDLISVYDDEGRERQFIKANLCNLHIEERT